MEKQNFKVMRSIPYFAKMKDDELRKYRVPPGFNNWNQVKDMMGKVDALNWLMLPPETGDPTATPLPSGAPPRTPAPATPTPATTPSPTIPRATPAPALTATPGASPTPSAWPSPVVEDAPDGTHKLSFSEGKNVINVIWKDGDETVKLYFKPRDAAEDVEPRMVDIPFDADRAKLLEAIFKAYVEARDASPPPSPR